jgi:hypothetical protein
MPGEIIGTDYDPDFSHAMLVAVLVKLGGSIELDATDLAPDAMGDAEGVLYRMALDPLARSALAPVGGSHRRRHPAAVSLVCSCR